MPKIIIILISIVLLVLIFYLADLKFEFKFDNKTKQSEPEADNTHLDTLSNAELNILKLVSEGKSNQQIANELFISVHTVKKHVSNIFKKLNLNSRSEARKYKNSLT
ncbi:MAG: response regulator transcription factor [Bacteroidales bacterium]|nr:response regulator transcription factor [Bacteroidales bacterium]